MEPYNWAYTLVGKLQTILFCVICGQLASLDPLIGLPHKTLE